MASQAKRAVAYNLLLLLSFFEAAINANQTGLKFGFLKNEYAQQILV